MARKPRQPETRLTRVEEEILRLLALGLSNQEIAERRRGHKSTIAQQLHSIYAKLGAKSRVQAALMYHGITTNEEQTAHAPFPLLDHLTTGPRFPSRMYDGPALHAQEQGQLR
jgi:DNA-binding CsgD family transcriptional regulator